METDLGFLAAATPAGRYAICDEAFCNSLHARLAPLEARLRALPRMDPPPPGQDDAPRGVNQLRQIYHFDPMQLLAALDGVSLHRDYLLEFLLFRPAVTAAPEARVYVRKRFVPAFIRNAQQFDMIAGAQPCVLHHLDFERTAEGVLQFFLLWFLLGNLFRPVDRQGGGELALYAEAQKPLLLENHGHALAAARPGFLEGLDLRPRVALGEQAATLQLHSFDWHGGLREREFRIAYPCEVSALGSETLIPPAASS